jgi:hypothetical protein
VAKCVCPVAMFVPENTYSNINDLKNISDNFQGHQNNCVTVVHTVLVNLKRQKYLSLTKHSAGKITNIIFWNCSSIGICFKNVNGVNTLI